MTKKGSFGGSKSHHNGALVCRWGPQNTKSFCTKIPGLTMESMLPRSPLCSSGEVCSTKASVQEPSPVSGLSGESSEKSDVGSVGVSGSRQSVSESWLDSDGEQDSVVFRFSAAKTKQMRGKDQSSSRMCCTFFSENIQILIWI